VVRVIDHRERGLRVVMYKVCSGCVPGPSSPAARHHQHRTGVHRPVIGRELPSLTDSLERRLVDQRGRRGDMMFVPLKDLRASDHEVAPELIVAAFIRPDGLNAVPTCKSAGQRRALCTRLSSEFQVGVSFSV
jgi:hypothetical protein